MKYLKSNITKKIIFIFAVVLLPLFLLAGIILQNIFESQVLKNSKNYIREVATEKKSFIDDYIAHRKGIGIRSAEFIKQKLGRMPTKAEFADFDQKYRYIDGALRTDITAFPNDDISAIFLSNHSQLTDDIKKTILATEGCFEDYAKAVKTDVFNMYLITKHQLIRIYEKDWSLEIEPDHDFTKDVFYYIADPEHNPQKTPQWTEVYYDSIWKHWMISLITPIYIDNEFIGILGHDVILDNIYDNILSKKLFNTGYGFLFDSDRNIIVHPDHLDKLYETAKMGTTMKLNVLDKGTIKAISRAMQIFPNGNSSVIEYTEENGSTNYIFTCKLNAMDWYYGAVIPKNEILKLLPDYRKRLLNFAALFSAIIFIIIIFITWFYILLPIINISKATHELGKGNLDYKIRFTSKDEFGDLANSFNNMTANLKNITASKKELDLEIAERKEKEQKLKEMQEELIATSRRAGMAEVASDVLHNVGNILNSINVSTTLVNRTLSNSEINNLKKVADMIEENSDNLLEFLKDDPKGKHIPSYIIKTAKLLTYEQEDIMDKLNILIDDVNHIKTIIKMQQEYAKASGVEIPTTIEQIIEDSIRINQAGLGRHRVQLIRDYADLGEVMIDKQRVIQILVNLISNGKYALSDSDVENKILTIRSYKQDEDFFCIEVSDNGVGIQKENLTKIFQHGFTTKKNGHGYGLHSSALAAKELNGLLTVNSEGLGHGATFTIKLPYKPAGTTDEYFQTDKQTYSNY